MDEIAIRVPSVESLFDEWSAEPLESRPLSEEARSRILDAWVDGSNRKQTPGKLLLLLPASERAEDLDNRILAAFRRDMTEMHQDAQYRWLRRSLKSRQTRLGFLAFFVALGIAVLLGQGDDGNSIYTLVNQTFVVIAWVALWSPADQIITAASYRLGRGSFAQLAEAPVEIRWE